MMGLARIGAAALAVSLLAASAVAQDIRDHGKTPAQLFASDCSACHKSPQGLSKGGGLFGLQGFLREHYTTSRETAAALAAYIEAVDRAAPPQQQRRPTTTTKRAPKDDKAKPGETKSDDKAETKPAPSEAKVPEPKASESKSAEPKAAEPKPAPTEAKPAEPKAESAPKSE